MIQFYDMCLQMSSILYLNIKYIVYTILIIGTLSHILFSSKIFNVVKKGAQIVAGGAAAKAGSDAFDATKEILRDKIEEFTKNTGNNNSTNNSNSGSNSANNSNSGSNSTNNSSSK